MRTSITTGFWQRQIANDRPLFDRLTARLNVVVDQLGRSLPEKEPEESTIGPNPPDFVRVDQSTSRARIVIVPFYTDILDTTFVESFRRAIETHWHVYVDGNEYRVVLKITTILPELLYCGTVDNREKRTPECFPPAQGAHINLEAHVAKFPADGAVLTTGAASLQLVADRAIELGPTMWRRARWHMSSDTSSGFRTLPTRIQGSRCRWLRGNGVRPRLCGYHDESGRGLGSATAL